jgi:hypothetical protein
VKRGVSVAQPAAINIKISNENTIILAPEDETRHSVQNQTNNNKGTMSSSSEQKSSIVSDPTKGVKINASVVAQSYRDEIKLKVQKLKEQGIGE